MLVAAVQFAPRFKDVEGNLSQMGALVETAASAGAKLIVLPELCTTGYSFMSKDEAAPYAEALNLSYEAGRSMLLMDRISREHQVAIAWGLVERATGRSELGALYNSQALIYPDGFIRYRKINFFGNDYLWAEQGKENPPIAQVFGRKTGLLICKDVRDKSPGNPWEEFYEPGDADIVCLSAAWGDGEFPASRWIKFAKENQVHLIVGNRYGRESANNFGEGGVCVVSPKGVVSCEGLAWSRPCIVYAEV